MSAFVIAAAAVARLRAEEARREARFVSEADKLVFRKPKEAK